MITIIYKEKEYGIIFSYGYENVICVEVVDLNSFGHEVVSDFELDIEDIENLENHIIEDIERRI